MQARRATVADLDAVVDTLVVSHLDYVWELWAVSGADRRARLTVLVRTFVELFALPSLEVWMQDDGSAVAPGTWVMWRRPPNRLR